MGWPTFSEAIKSTILNCKRATFCGSMPVDRETGPPMQSSHSYRTSLVEQSQIPPPSKGQAVGGNCRCMDGFCLKTDRDAVSGRMSMKNHPFWAWEGLTGMGDLKSSSLSLPVTGLSLVLHHPCPPYSRSAGLRRYAYPATSPGRGSSNQRRARRY